MNADQSLRNHLLALLEGRGARMPFESAVADFPEMKINTAAPNVPYTFWHLVEHLRITQWDILDYMRNPDYTYIRWPDDYWPPRDQMADLTMWNRSVQQFRDDLEAIRAIVRNPEIDLYAQIPHGEPGHTYLREVLLVADHNAYHIGELGILRQVMSAWPDQRDGQ